jgi:hypothetical protein
MSRTTTFKKTSRALKWPGYYSRIPGKSPVFHARADGSGDVEWNPWRSDERLKSAFVPDEGIEAMIQAINELKQEKTGVHGGAFLINEYGQVLVPVTHSDEKYLVGELSGCPEFIDPRSGKNFKLEAPRGTRVGMSWDLPYVGMKFKFNGEGEVARELTLGDERLREYPPRRDEDLSERLCQLRPQGGRMIVNLHGVVLTKVDGGKPVFVGEINIEKWFAKTH